MNLFALKTFFTKVELLLAKQQQLIKTNQELRETLQQLTNERAELQNRLALAKKNIDQILTKLPTQQERLFANEESNDQAN